MPLAEFIALVVEHKGEFYIERLDQTNEYRIRVRVEAKNRQIVHVVCSLPDVELRCARSLRDPVQGKTLEFLHMLLVNLGRNEL